MSMRGSNGSSSMICDSDGNAPNKERKILISEIQAQSLLEDCKMVLKETMVQLQRAGDLVSRAGLSVESSILPKSNTAVDGLMVEGSSSSAVATIALRDTGGHSNTDHTIARTGNAKADLVVELKRNLLRRHRAMQPESRGNSKWDKEKVKGERRRRIVREADRDGAPPEPPHTGYNVFVTQMTVKIRHDRPNEPHNQARVVQEISKIWNQGQVDREYYNAFAREAKEEYEVQKTEYRATGSFQRSQKFRRFIGTNVWIRLVDNLDELVPLERELCSYDTVLFPPRPPELDEEYAAREKRSIFRRKLKVKGLLEEDGKTLKDGREFEQAFLEEVEHRKPPPPGEKKKKRRQRKRKFVDAYIAYNRKDEIDNKEEESDNHNDGDDDATKEYGMLGAVLLGKASGHSPSGRRKLSLKATSKVTAAKASRTATNSLAVTTTPQQNLRMASPMDRSSPGRRSGPNAYVLVDSGPATDIGEGWEERTYERLNGKWKGRRERAWHTPIEKYKFRTMGEVRRFLLALADCNGDERMAKKSMKKYF